VAIAFSGNGALSSTSVPTKAFLRCGVSLHSKGMARTRRTWEPNRLSASDHSSQFLLLWHFSPCLGACLLPSPQQCTPILVLVVLLLTTVLVGTISKSLIVTGAGQAKEASFWDQRGRYLEGVFRVLQIHRVGSLAGMSGKPGSVNAARTMSPMKRALTTDSCRAPEDLRALCQLGLSAWITVGWPIKSGLGREGRERASLGREAGPFLDTEEP